MATARPSTDVTPFSLAFFLFCMEKKKVSWRYDEEEEEGGGGAGAIEAEFMRIL